MSISIFICSHQWVLIIIIYITYNYNNGIVCWDHYSSRFNLIVSSCFHIVRQKLKIVKKKTECIAATRCMAQILGNVWVKAKLLIKPSCHKYFPQSAFACLTLTKWNLLLINIQSRMFWCLLLTLNIFHTLPYCFYCWLWTSKCW